MLVWTQHSDGWRANGFTIRLVEPFRWVLVKTDADSGPVRVPARPLAETRTLTECKREAELIATAAERAGLRRRWAAQGLAALGALAFATDLAGPWDVVVVSILGVLVLRCISLVADSFLTSLEYSHHDFFYQ